MTDINSMQFRRVVTGVDSAGRSRVAWDTELAGLKAPSMGSGRRYTDLWIWEGVPPDLDGEDTAGRGYHFPGPPLGGHLRLVRADGPPPGYDPANDRDLVQPHEPRVVPPGRMWDRGYNNAFTSPMHKTETVDYGIVVAGERDLILDEYATTMRPGDVVVQVGAWHRWACPRQTAIMVFDMIGAHFVDGAVGLGQGADTPARPRTPGAPMIDRPTRRIVTIDREPSRSSLVSDGPCPDVHLDPARPGFSLERLWVIDSSPAKIAFETVGAPLSLLPPTQGSILWVQTIPPDESWRGRARKEDVQAYFSSLDALSASAFHAKAPHPYLQKTSTIDFCVILEGELVLVLDTEEVLLRPGHVVIQRGTRHAWSNRGDAPVRLAIASHSAV